MDSNNYVTIQGWMRTELDLKGNDLLVYAIIYGFSQTAEQKFTGGLQYIADWCGATKQGILKNLSHLLDMGLIEKTESYINNVKVVEYRSTEFNSIKQSLMGVKQSLIKNTNNTIYRDIISNTNVLDNISQKKPRKNMYQHCIDEINRYTDDKLKSILVDYLNDILGRNDEKKLKSYAQWKGLLNKLDELTDDESVKIEIVKQSISKHWATFVALKTYRQNDESYRLKVFGEQNVSSQHATDEEREEMARWRRENNVESF